MPKVSICIPNFNHSLFLKERIESILDQSFSDYEIVILDDYSSDNSNLILEQYRNHPKVSHIIYNESNSGNTFKQWQKGIGLAKGDYIWIAESDDIMQPSFLEKALEVFKKNDNVGIFQCGSNRINTDGIITASEHTHSTGHYSGADFILRFMTMGNDIINASAVVFKKSLVKLPLSKEILNLKFCGDWLFWIKILEKADLYYLNENLNGFRYHENNVTGKSKKAGLLFIEGIQVYAYIRHKFPARFRPLDLRDRNWAFRFVKENFPLKPSLQFLKNSFKASLFIPLYVLWFKFKKVMGLFNLPTHN